MSRKLRDCVRHTDLSLSHHLAFWDLVESKLPAGFLENTGEGGALWISAPELKPAAPVRLISFSQAKLIFQRNPTEPQLDDLNACMVRFAVNTPARMRHFLAQVAHESGGLRWMKELASGEAYEGRKDLGNTKTGDGKLFKGAGALQLTGRANYRALADFLGDQDVMRGCDYVAETYPFTSAGFWWQNNKMNALVDSGATCRQVSARVNGRDPANNLADREAAFERAVAAIPAGPGITLQQEPAKLTPKSPFSTRLTPHIRLGEFALDQEKRRFRHQYQVDTAAELAAFAERARTYFGGKPVVITSGYRPPVVNRSVGGATNSEHLFSAPGVGAIDFYIQGVDVKALETWCDANWPCSLGFGAPKGFVHLGIRAGRPRVRWDYV